MKRHRTTNNSRSTSRYKGRRKKKDDLYRKISRTQDRDLLKRDVLGQYRRRKEIQ